MISCVSSSSGSGTQINAFLLAARLQVPVDAVHARVQAPADPPLPERRIARVEHRVPLAVPRQHLRVLREALREMLLAEPLEDRRVVRVRLRDERRRRRVVLLLTPMNRDLRLRNAQPRQPPPRTVLGPLLPLLNLLRKTGLSEYQPRGHPSAARLARRGKALGSHPGGQRSPDVVGADEPWASKSNRSGLGAELMSVTDVRAWEERPCPSRYSGPSGRRSASTLSKTPAKMTIGL